MPYYVRTVQGQWLCAHNKNVSHWKFEKERTHKTAVFQRYAEAVRSAVAASEAFKKKSGELEVIEITPNRTRKITSI